MKVIMISQGEEKTGINRYASGIRQRKFEISIFYKACLAQISQKLMRKFVSLMRGS